MSSLDKEWRNHIFCMMPLVSQAIIIIICSSFCQKMCHTFITNNSIDSQLFVVMHRVYHSFSANTGKTEMPRRKLYWSYMVIFQASHSCFVSFNYVF